VEILRTNRELLDPLFFAIYGDIIYHHGAGFRKGGASRRHYDSVPKPLPAPNVPGLRPLFRRIDAMRVQRWRVMTRGPQILESRRMFAKIEREDPDWLDAIRQ
jgi:hypothetical protein